MVWHSRSIQLLNCRGGSAAAGGAAAAAAAPGQQLQAAVAAAAGLVLGVLERFCESGGRKRVAAGSMAVLSDLVRSEGVGAGEKGVCGGVCSTKGVGEPVSVKALVNGLPLRNAESGSTAAVACIDGTCTRYAGWGVCGKQAAARELVWRVRRCFVIISFL